MTRNLTLLFSPVLLIGVLLTGCAVDFTKTEAYQKLDARMKKLETAVGSIDQLAGKLGDLQIDIQALKDKQSDSGLSAELSAAAQRITKLEQEIQKITESVNKKEVSAPAQPKSAPSGAPAGKPAVSTSKKPASAASASTKGSYYEVKEGDTLQSIARAHKVTAAAICQANHLPMSAVPRPGTSLFIPGK
jgi:LysM repeat protein